MIFAEASIDETYGSTEDVMMGRCRTAIRAIKGVYHLHAGGKRVRQPTRQQPKIPSRKQIRRRKVRRRRVVSYAIVTGILVSASAISFNMFELKQDGHANTAGEEPTTVPSVKGTPRSSVHDGSPNSTQSGTPGVATNSSGNFSKQSGMINAVTLPTSAMIDVPAQNQHPQLPNGCEVTSLSMLFDAIGHPVSKMTLAREEPFDPTPLVRDKAGSIVSWGNPNVGFVGSPYVWSKGFGIYHGPILKLIDKILPGEAVDLTKKPFEDLLDYVAHGAPVEAWVNTTLKPTNKFWVTWESPEGPVHTTLEEHAVLIVGYDKTNIYINNPFNGEKQESVKRSDFIGAWRQLGEQALTIALPSQGTK